LIGHTSAIAVQGESNPALQLIGSGATSNSWMNLVRFADNSGSSVLNFGKGRSNTIGTMTVVQDDDALGIISAAGADGTDMTSVAGQIRFEVDGAPGSNDMPGRIEFSTTADGASSPTERWRINSNGNLSNGAGDRADLATGFSINQGSTLSLFQVTHSGGILTAEVMIHMDANSGYAGRVVRGIWYVRKAPAGSSHNWVELSNTSLGSVNSGVVSVPTVTISSQDAGSDVFKLKVSYSGAGATSTARATITAIGSSARTLREVN